MVSRSIHESVENPRADDHAHSERKQKISMALQYYHKVWFILGFGWVSLYLVRMGISPLLGLIMEEFHISYAAAGSLFSTIFYAYTLMQLPSGFLGDRFGRRRILIAGSFLWFVFSLGTSLVQGFTALVALRFLTGMSHGIYFGNDRPTIMAFTPKEKMGKGQGISFMGLPTGYFLSVFFSGMIAEYTHNWRWVFVIFAFPSLLTSFLVFKHIREPRSAEQNRQPINARSAYRRVLSDRDLRLMYLAGFAMLFGFWVIATWMPSIYREIGIRGTTAGAFLSGILGLVGIPGLLISSILTDRIAQKGYGRKGFAALLVLLWAVLMFGIGYAIESKANPTLISIMFFGSGLVVFGSWSPYYTLLGELAPEDIVGTTFGVAHFIGFLSAWLAPYLTGWIKDVTGSFAAGCTWPAPFCCP